MKSEYGTINGFFAVRYSNGKVFARIGGQFYQMVGQEHQFKTN